MYSDVTGIILAGGKSTRMGTNKSLLKINGKTVIENVVDLMSSIFEKVIIITNTPDEYEFVNVPKYKDIFEYKGPLAGIHSGLTYSTTEENFIISCDIPLMTKEMIEFIVEFKTNQPVTVCKADGFIQQLASRYSKSVLSVAEQSLEEGNQENRDGMQIKRKCKVLSLLDTVGVEILEAESLEVYKADMFLNMNRKEDYEKIVNIPGQN